MLYFLLVLLIPMIMYSIYPYLDFILSRTNKTVIKSECHDNSLILDKAKCFESKVDLCPMSSYKQCTNNTYPIGDSKCNCLEKSYELCKQNQQFSEKCYYNKVIKKPDIHIIGDNSCKNNRVNMYHGKKSLFDYISELEL